MEESCARRKKRQPIPKRFSGDGSAPPRFRFGFPVILCLLFRGVCLAAASAASRTCLCQAHATVPMSKIRLTVSTISYQITKSLDIKNVLSNFHYPTIALCGLRPRHFDLAFMRNYIALKHVFDMHPKSWTDFWRCISQTFLWVQLGTTWRRERDSPFSDCWRDKPVFFQKLVRPIACSVAACAACPTGETSLSSPPRRNKKRTHKNGSVCVVEITGLAFQRAHTESSCFLYSLICASVQRGGMQGMPHG